MLIHEHKDRIELEAETDQENFVIDNLISLLMTSDEYGGMANEHGCRISRGEYRNWCMIPVIENSEV